MTSGHISLKFHQNRVIYLASTMQNVKLVLIAITHSLGGDVSSKINIRCHIRFSKLVMNKGLTILNVLTRFQNPVNCTFASISLTIHTTLVANPQFQSFWAYEKLSEQGEKIPAKLLVVLYHKGFFHHNY